MATGTRLMQEISNQFLNCKICFESFRDPKTLTCMHTFCCSCLQQHYEQEISSRQSRYAISIYNRQVTCPLCRKKTDLPTGGVKRLPDNFLVSNLTEVLAKRTVSKIPPCEICSTVRAKNVDACSKCLDCSKLLCKACVCLHLSTKVTQQHSLIDLEGEKDIQCKAHPDEYVRFYCEPCAACICVVCAFQEHKDHEVCSFSDGSAKNRTSLETLLGKCKERLSDVSTRLNAIEKYETVVKDVKDRIRDLAISYIAQVRAKEKDLMKRIEEEYGGEIKDFVDQKQILQESMDELQSTCNLTDIMLKDKGVELLLIKKDVEGKMNQLLQPLLPDVPENPKYDVRFVPGDVALGRLSFGGNDDEKDNSDDKGVISTKMMLEESKNDCLSHMIEPDVITDTSPTDKSRTKEMSTSMSSDMRSGFSHTNSQTDSKSVMSRDTCTNQVETRERGVFAKVYDMKARGTMTERSDVRSLKCQTDHMSSNAKDGDLLPSCSLEIGRSEVPQCKFENVSFPPTANEQSGVSQTYTGRKGLEAEIGDSIAVDIHKPTSRGDCRPAPDLLPTSVGVSAFVYTPGRKIRSIKIQTEISSLDVGEAAESTDKEFISTIVQSQMLAEAKKKQDHESTSSYSRFRDRPRRVRGAGVVDDSEAKATPDVEMPHRGCTGVRVPRDVTRIDALSGITQRRRSSIGTWAQNQVVKATHTQSVVMTDKDTCTPVITLENKDTWTEVLSTSDRATSTIAAITLDRSTGTVPIKTGDMGVQIKPYVSAVSTNTPIVSSSDHECQTKVDTSEQGTMPDLDIEIQIANKDKRPHKGALEVLESSVDFVTLPQSPIKQQVQTVDRATDPIKTPCFSKATETANIKTVTSCTETHIVKFLDKETATIDAKTVDQWTETQTPQLVSTGVTPPVPATLDVGVATNVILTDEQATCTDIKAYRNSHTETVIVVCDNETLTDITRYSDAQTSMEVSTDNQECETEKMENADEGCMTDHICPWERVICADTQATQYEAPILQTTERNTTRKRKKPKETQTIFTPSQCTFCGHINVEDIQLNPGDNSISAAKLECKLAGDIPGLSGKEFKDSSTMPFPLSTQEVGTMAISCVTCLHDFHEAAIQTSHPQLYDKSSATSFDLDLDFLERALSKDYQDAATSTESLPYIGLLSEIDVDELIVLPEATFELISDTDSDYDLIMVDDETSTDLLQSVETGTQTFVAVDDGAESTGISSMTESTGSRGVGEIIKCLVDSQGLRLDNLTDISSSKHFVSIGVNTTPKPTFEKETCTPISHLFSKGTMTFFVTKMDKSTSTLNQARIITGSSIRKIKYEDKVTMTTRPEKKNVSVETEAAVVDGKITKCISKLRSVSEKLNSPPARKCADNDAFFGINFTPSRAGIDYPDKMNNTLPTNGLSSMEKPEEERQRQLKTLLEQTQSFLKSKDRSPIRKPQPITTLKGRKCGAVDTSLSSVNNSSTCQSTETLKLEDTTYGSKSLPRGFSSERPGTVRMGSQPLSPSRLPLLRYNSAPGRIATVPTQTLLKISGQGAPVLGPNSSPRLSPSKIPISKKLSPPDYQIRQPQQLDHQLEEAICQEMTPAIPSLRRPLPSITETRTPSSCSDSSTTSFISAESGASITTSSNTNYGALSAVSSRLSTDSAVPITTSSPTFVDSFAAPVSICNIVSVDSATAPPRSPSTTTSLSVTSSSLSDSVFRKSFSEMSQSAESSDTMEDRLTQEDKTISTPPKKSGMGFMQRLLSRKKKVPDVKKEPVPLLKSGPPTAVAVAALASAVPPLPAAASESYAITPLHLPPPHHYPPLSEHSSPSVTRKPRPFVYLQQRIVSIQQDNVEEIQGKISKPEDQIPERTKEESVAAKDKRKEKEKTSEKQKDKTKKEVQSEKEKKKKEEKTKEKSKVKVVKTKAKNPSPLPARKDGGEAEVGNSK